MTEFAGESVSQMCDDDAEIAKVAASRRLSDEESFKVALERFKNYFDVLDQLGDLSKAPENHKNKHQKVELSKVGAKPLSGIRGIYFSKGCWKTKYVDNDGDIAMCILPYEDDITLLAGFDVALALLDKIISYGRQVNTEDGCIIDEPTREKLMALDSRKRGKLAAWAQYIDMEKEYIGSRRARRDTSINSNELKNSVFGFGYGGEFLKVSGAELENCGPANYGTYECYYYENREASEGNFKGSTVPKGVQGSARQIHTTSAASKAAPGIVVNQASNRYPIGVYDSSNETLSESPSEIDDLDDEDYNHSRNRRPGKPRKKVNRHKQSTSSKASSSKRSKLANRGHYTPSAFEKRFEACGNIDTRRLLEHIIDHGSLTDSKIPYILESSWRGGVGCMYPWQPGVGYVGDGGVGYGGYYSQAYYNFGAPFGYTGGGSEFKYTSTFAGASYGSTNENSGVSLDPLKHCASLMVDITPGGGSGATNVASAPTASWLAPSELLKCPVAQVETPTTNTGAGVDVSTPSANANASATTLASAITSTVPSADTTTSTAAATTDSTPMAAANASTPHKISRVESSLESTLELVKMYNYDYCFGNGR